MSPEERMSLMSTDESLSAKPEPRMPSRISGLESFSLIETEEEVDPRGRGDDILDPDDLFNLPGGGTQDEDEDEQPR